MSIKYYRLAKDEEPPDEFCAVRDINGEPSEYTFYEQMSEFDHYLWDAFRNGEWFAGSEYRKLKAENAKLWELVHLVAEYVSADQCEGCVAKPACNAGELDMCWIRKAILEKLRELEIEADG